MLGTPSLQGDVLSSGCVTPSEATQFIRTVPGGGGCTRDRKKIADEVRIQVGVLESGQHRNAYYGSFTLEGQVLGVQLGIQRVGIVCG